MTYDLCIIGGGASGLYLASRLANKNVSVILCESGERLGRKLSATGNGQGNVTNLNISEKNYFGSVSVSDKLLSNKDLLSVFPMLFTADELGRVYPAGRQASALTDALRRIVTTASNIEVRLSSKAVRLESGFVIHLQNGEKIYADKLALCAGGKAQKQFGTDGNAYAMASRFGHKISPLYPSLVQLKTPTDKIKTLKGLRANGKVKATQNGKVLGEAYGDIIFADYGVTGNAIFAISAFVSGKENVELQLSFLPDVAEKDIAESVRKKIELGYERSELLSGTLNNQIGRMIMKTAGSTPEQIASAVKNFILPVLGTLSFDYAQVTKGGITGEGINENLESKYAKGLYFAGEILDVDGECGGYNLHWAFSSAAVVAEAILRNKRDI